MAGRERVKMPKWGDVKQASRIFRYVMPYKGLFILNLVLLVITTLSALLIPYLGGMLIDVAQGDTSIFSGINQVALLMGGILLFQAILSFTRIIIQTNYSERAILDLRNDLYSKIITLPQLFFNQNRVGDLTSRLSNDVTTLNSTFTSTLPQFVRQIFTMLGGIGLITFLNPRLTLIMLGTIPIMVIAAIVFGRFIKKLSKERQKTLAESNTIAEETFHAVQSVKAFTNELFETKRFNQSIQKVLSLAMKGSYYRAAFIAFVTVGFLGAFVFIIWQAGIMLQQESITGGQFVQFITVSGFVAGSIAGFGESLTAIQRTIGATERVEELLDETSELTIEEKDGSSFSFEHQVAIENVSFHYPGERTNTVLDTISFSIQKGEKVALVGPSGAGKSTIAQLLLRLYDVNDGSISVDGEEISSFDLSEYRKNIGFVPQEVLLFGGTVRENIAYGDLKASDEEIISAAKMANAWEFIEKSEQGLDTVVGERGVQLSGGQKQRIAIARALLKNPPILILDEATSALDAESEYLVQEALETLMENRTTLIIAHRLSTVRNCDNIIVIEDGSIAEQGNHDGLLQQDGVYSNLVELQLR